MAEQGESPPSEPDRGTPQPQQGPQDTDRAIAPWRARVQRLEKQLAHQQEAHTQATEKVMERLLRAEVRAAAAGKLRNPDDAEKFIDLSTFKANGEGEYDQAALGAAVDRLLEERQYLAPPPPPEPGPLQTVLPGHLDNHDRPTPVDMNTLIRRATGRG